MPEAYIYQVVLKSRLSKCHAQRTSRAGDDDFYTLHMLCRSVVPILLGSVPVSKVLSTCAAVLLIPVLIL